MFSDKALVALLDSAACGTMPADNTAEIAEEPGEGADADRGRGRLINDIMLRWIRGNGKGKFQGLSRVRRAELGR